MLVKKLVINYFKKVIMPNKIEVDVEMIKINDINVEMAEIEEIVQIYIKSNYDFEAGSVICNIENPLFP